MIDIETLTETELIELHNRVGTRLNAIQKARTETQNVKAMNVAKESYEIGDGVTFQAPMHVPVSGILEKFNRKTVSVRTDDGERWNVPAEFLLVA